MKDRRGGETLQIEPGLQAGWCFLLARDRFVGVGPSGSDTVHASQPNCDADV